MRNNKIFLGVLTMALTLALVLAACGGKKNSGGGGSSSGGSGSSDVSVSVGAVKGTGKNYTMSKDSDFVYDLVKIDGTDYVQIKGFNRPVDFKNRERADQPLIDTLTVKVPEKIEGYTVGAIGESAFIMGGSYLVAVTIPDTVLEIGEKAFAGTSISSIKLPKNLKKLGWGAFWDCKNLGGSLSIPAGVTEIPMFAFSGTAITEVSIPDSVTTIISLENLNGAFQDCKELTTVKLPSHPITYAVDAFNADNAEGRKVIRKKGPNEMGPEFLVEDPANNATFNGCGKLSLATRKAIEESGYKGKF